MISHLVILVRQAERDAYFGEVNDAQAEGREEGGSKPTKGGGVKSKGKTVKEGEEDPFASDGGEGGDVEPKANHGKGSGNMVGPKGKKRTKEEQENVEDVEKEMGGR